MRILFLGNNRLAAQIVQVLRDEGETIVALVLHPPERRTGGEEIVRAAGQPGPVILDGARLRDAEVIETLRALELDVAISVLFGYRLEPALLRLPPGGCINLHPSLLPHNRGAFPNVWSIVDQTPAGVTLHYMDEELDTGDIIAQQEVPIEPVDTGETLYRRLEEEALELFRRTWPQIRAGRINRAPQPAGGTCHRVQDVAAIDEIDLDREYSARYLLNVLRARTFPPYRGAYFVHEGRRVHLRLHLEYESDSPVETE